MFGDSTHGLDHHGRGLAEGGRRSQGGGRRAADRQPRRLGHGQRPDLARDGPRPRSRWSPAWATWPAAAAITSPWARGKIFAEPGTITGSIGVIGGKLVTARAVRQAGPDHRGHQPRQEQRRAVVDAALHARRAQGVDRAAGGDLPPVRRQGGPGAEDGPQAAGGAGPGPRLHRPHGQEPTAWSTSWARSHDAIAEAKKAAGLKPDADVDLLILPRPKTVFEQLFGDGRRAPTWSRRCPRCSGPAAGEALAAVVRPPARAVDALWRSRAIGSLGPVKQQVEQSYSTRGADRPRVQ